MAVVLRLQGLPVVAGSADVRHFFAGLQIPVGGVHIVGGDRGEAFIIFATDEDARRAMGCSGGFIKNSVIRLYLSSKTEMQNTVVMNLKVERGSLHMGSVTPGVGPITNLVSEIKKGIHLSGCAGGPEVGMNNNGTRDTNLDISKATYGGEPVDAKALSLSSVQYLNLTDMPFLITEEEVRAFFQGLRVDDLLLLRNPDSRRNGKGIVKFSSNKDALEGLKRNKQYIGSSSVEVTPSSEEEWSRAGELLKSEMDPHGRRRKRFPVREMQAKHRSGTDSPPKKQRVHSYSPPHDEFYVHMKNLPKHTGKRPIMKFFKDLDLTDTQIKIISTKHNTMDAFVVLKNKADYNKALGFHKEMLNDQRIYIYAISRKSMLEMIDDYEAFQRKHSLDRERPKENLADNRFNTHSGSRILYLRNFPFDVTALEVKKFFVGLDVHEKNIQLLTDGKGVGLGEALVKFSSEEHVKNAESLNRHRFLGTEVLLQRVSEEQVEEMGLKVIPDVKDQDSRHPPFGAKGFSSVELPGGSDGFKTGPGELKSIPDKFRGLTPHMGIEEENSFGRKRMDGLPSDAKIPQDEKLPGGRFSDRFPDGRLPDGRLPEGKFPDGRLPDEKFLEGRFPDGRLPDGRFPDGRLPDGRFPDGRLPDGRFPDGRLPDGRFPDGRLPDGRFPDGRLPDGRFPDGRLPDGRFPDGRLPDGRFPDGRLPDGRFPDGRLPDGRFPDGRLPDGRFPDGRLPDGRFPDGRLPDGRFPDGKLPDGRFPDGRLPDGRFPDSRLPDGRFPDGRLPDGRFPDGRLPDGRFPDGRLPDSRFPDGRLPDGRCPDGRLPQGQFPDGRLPSRSFPNQVTGKLAGGVTKIRLNNLPYTARVDEIVDFFYGFPVVPGSVNISYTTEGLPTGIATIAIESYENAVAAINELNERPVGPRKVSLSLVNDQEVMRP